MDDDFKKGLLGVTTEVGGGIATDVATTPLLGLGPAGVAAYVATNFGQGAYTNYLVQKHLYGNENINWGEVFGSGVAGAIPFMNIGASAKAAKYVGKAGSVKRGIVGGLGTALVGEQTRVGIDEKRPLTLQEIAFAGGLGGTLGGGLTSLGRKTKLNQLKKVRKTKSNLKTLQKNIKEGQPPIPGGMQEEFTPEGLKGVLLQQVNYEGYQPRLPAINTVNLSSKGIIAKLNKAAAELGFTPPNVYDLNNNKLTVRLKNFKKYPTLNTPAGREAATIYSAYEAAYWQHIQDVLATNPGAMIDMRTFPDLIHDGITYRPLITPNTIDGKRVLKGATVIDRNERKSKGKLGRSRRLDQLDELNRFSGSNTKRWLQSRKSKIDELNDRLVAEGKHPIGEVESISGVHGDHRFPINMTQAFGAGLSDKYKRIVYGHLVRAGGYLGDEIDNVIIYNKLINIQKESKLKYYIKLRKHKSAQSFGKFDRNNPKSFQTEEQQKARVEYYTTPRKETGLTPIEEYVEDVYKAEQWAEQQMDAVLGALERILPEELDVLPESDLKVLVEIFGSMKSVKAYVQQLRDNEAMGMPPALIQEMIYDEIWSRVSGLFK
tara:strand:+ start:735 stop:2543 length:1809 start_codon:yes stop_codon:yes gene_type:complete